MKTNWARWLCLMAVLGALLLAAACGAGAEDPEGDPPVSVLTTQENNFLTDDNINANAGVTEEDAARGDTELTHADTAPDEYIVPPEDLGTYLVETETVTSETGNTTIRYPRISGWEEGESPLILTEESWNEYFSFRANNLMAAVYEEDTCQLDFRVKTRDKYLLSIYYEGYYNASDAPYPTALVATFNIFMQTGEAATLSRTADIPTVAQWLLNGWGEIGTEGISIEEILAFNGLDPEDEEGLIAFLEGFDDAPGKTEIPTGYSYWEGNVLHLVFEIHHAAGDYVDIALRS